MDLECDTMDLECDTMDLECDIMDLECDTMDLATGSPTGSKCSVSEFQTEQTFPTIGDVYEHNVQYCHSVHQAHAQSPKSPKKNLQAILFPLLSRGINSVVNAVQYSYTTDAQGSDGVLGQISQTSQASTSRRKIAKHSKQWLAPLRSELERQRARVRGKLLDPDEVHGDCLCGCYKRAAASKRKQHVPLKPISNKAMTNYRQLAQMARKTPPKRYVPCTEPTPRTEGFKRPECFTRKLKRNNRNQVQCGQLGENIEKQPQIRDLLFDIEDHSEGLKTTMPPVIEGGSTIESYDSWSQSSEITVSEILDCMTDSCKTESSRLPHPEERDEAVLPEVQRPKNLQDIYWWRSANLNYKQAETKDYGRFLIQRAFTKSAFIGNRLSILPRTVAVNIQNPKKELLFNAFKAYGKITDILVDYFGECFVSFSTPENTNWLCATGSLQTPRGDVVKVRMASEDDWDRVKWLKKEEDEELLRNNNKAAKERNEFQLQQKDQNFDSECNEQSDSESTDQES